MPRLLRAAVTTGPEPRCGFDWLNIRANQENNRLDGEVLKLHKKGHVMRKEVYANGKRVSSESFADGKVVHTQTYQEGKRSGEEVAYFAGTDQVKLVVRWKASKKLEQLEFYQNGNPKEVRIFGRDGAVTVTRYREDGSRYSEGGYIERGSAWWPYLVPHGSYKHFSDDGHLSEAAAYSSGQLHGQRKLYNSTQALSREELYEKGVLLSARDYDRVGQLIRETQFFPDGSVKKIIEAPQTL